MTTTAESVAAYRNVQNRMTAMVRGLDTEAAAAIVPATPDWQVHDLIAHVVGITADLIAGDIEGAGSDPWTAKQVAQRKSASLAELLDEWEANWSPFAETLTAMDPVQAAQVVFDVSTHEHDLRGALDQPGERDSDAVVIGWGWATDILGQLRDGYEAGALALRTPKGETVAGAGEPTGAVEADRFDLWRAMTGRRSVEQVQAYTWEGEPAVDHLCLLPARSTPLTE
jgi:hypothetical protein